MKIKLLAFGITREILGERDVEIDLELPENASVGDFRDALFRAYPKLEALRSLGIAIDNAYTSDDDPFRGDAEVALIPPVSGG